MPKKKKQSNLEIAGELLEPFLPILVGLSFGILVVIVLWYVLLSGQFTP